MAHFVNSAARAAYAPKSDAELQGLAEKVRETIERNNAAPYRRADAPHMVRGRLVYGSAAEAANNAARVMLADIETILAERGAR